MFLVVAWKGFEAVIFIFCFFRGFSLCLRNLVPNPMGRLGPGQPITASVFPPIVGGGAGAELPPAGGRGHAGRADAGPGQGFLRR